jgi:hypothetical protein
MHTFQMNLLFCLVSIIAVQQLPMAIAGGGSVRLLKAKREGASSFSSTRKLKNSVKGPAKRDCKMCKFQSRVQYGIFVYSVSVLFVS